MKRTMKDWTHNLTESTVKAIKDFAERIDAIADKANGKPFTVKPGVTVIRRELPKTWPNEALYDLSDADRKKYGRPERYYEVRRTRNGKSFTFLCMTAIGAAGHIDKGTIPSSDETDFDYSGIHRLAYTLAEDAFSLDSHLGIVQFLDDGPIYGIHLGENHFPYPDWFPVVNPNVHDPNDDSWYTNPDAEKDAPKPKYFRYHKYKTDAAIVLLRQAAMHANSQAI